MDAGKTGPTSGQIREKLAEGIDTLSAAQAFRALTEPSGREPPEESLGAALTKTVFDAQAANNKMLLEEKRAAEESRTTAERELHQVRVQTLKDLEGRLLVMGDHLSSGNKGGQLEELPKIIATLKEVGNIFGWGAPSGPKGDTAVPASIMVELQGMKQTHDLAIEELKNERQERQNQFTLDVKKWEDEKALRWATLKHDEEKGQRLGQHFSNAMAELGKRLNGEEVPVADQPPQPTPQRPTTLALELDQAECPTCHEPLLIPKGSAPAYGCPKCQTAMKRTAPSEQAMGGPR